MIYKIIPHFKLNNNGKIIQLSGGAQLHLILIFHLMLLVKLEL